MTNILDIEPVYITVQDVRDSTTNTTLAWLTDTEIKGLIYQAQIMIDTYLGQVFYESLEEQEFIYPLYSEDANWDAIWYIPKEIPLATLYTVDYLCSNGIDKSNSQYDIQSETSWPRSVTFWDVVTDSKGLSLPSSAMAILSTLKNRFYNIPV